MLAVSVTVLIVLIIFTGLHFCSVMHKLYFHR